MIRWQRRARLGVGVFGIASAIAVYAAWGDRQTTAPVDRPARMDPRAIIESAGAAFQQFQQARQDFVIEADRQLTYEGGASKFIGVTIKVKNRGGRDFVVTAREAEAKNDNNELLATGEVKLVASDGFTLTADQATFNRPNATMQVPEAVTFSKGRMAGSGGGMMYNQTTDVLSLAQDAHVTMANDAGETVNEFTSSTATLARLDKYLSLQGNVKALRDEQVIEADQALARLSDDQEHINFIELRGNARVAGGRLFDSMSARDIDLDYTDDGVTLERVTLRGDGGIAMRGDEEGESGRQFAGDTLDLTFAPDATLTGVIGRGNVRVDLPASGSASGRTPARAVQADAFEGSGVAGKGLTVARFTGNVQFREAAQAKQTARTARSNTLQIGLANDAVTQAAFAGNVRFAEGDLTASGAQADYNPAAGTLAVTGTDAGGSPRVADAQVQIEAAAISITLAGPRMVATGVVKTMLQPPDARAGSGPSTPPGTAGANRLPGLFQQAAPVNVNANALDYSGGGGRAVYTGNATLWQGETAIRADVLTIDRTRGDLIATGAARSNMVFESGVSIGRGPEIRYDDATRVITYGPPMARAVAAALPAPLAPAGLSQLSGSQGDLQAVRIEVVLAKTESRIERLEAYTAVNVRLDTRIATGDRLTYHAGEERYVMTGIPTVPVKIVEECRETLGRTVTFFRTADRIIVDGNEEVRTRSSRGAACPQTPAR
jgi:lipopolysaccharide export system protein LptA